MVDSANKDEKREKIIQAALRRFAHFGQEKTAMQEIADDLKISKASLYYYFPDKRRLCLEVMKHVGEQYFGDLRKVLKKDISAADCLREMNKVGYHYLLEFNRTGLFEMFKSISAIKEEDEEIREAHQEIISILVRVIERGVKQGEWEVQHPGETAELYMHTMHGLRMAAYTDPGHFVSSDQQLTDVLFKNSAKLTEIFIKGMQ